MPISDAAGYPGNTWKDSPDLKRQRQRYTYDLSKPKHAAMLVKRVRVCGYASMGTLTTWSGGMRGGRDTQKEVLLQQYFAKFRLYTQPYFVESPFDTVQIESRHKTQLDALVQIIRGYLPPAGAEIPPYNGDNR